VAGAKFSGIYGLHGLLRPVPVCVCVLVSTIVFCSVMFIYSRVAGLFINEAN